MEPESPDQEVAAGLRAKYAPDMSPKLEGTLCAKGYQEKSRKSGAKDSNLTPRKKRAVSPR